MNSLTASLIHPANMTVSWAELTDPTLNGGDVPIFYSVESKSSDPASNWTILNSYVGDPVTTNFTYILPVGFIFNETLLYYYRVRAMNGVGLSIDYSPVLTVMPCTRPIGMYTPTLFTAATPTLVSIQWTILTSTTLNGGDVPNFYSVEYSYDSSNWYVINAGGKLTYSISHSPGTILTNVAFYRVRAQNDVGMSDNYSNGKWKLCAK